MYRIKVGFKGYILNILFILVDTISRLAKNNAFIGGLDAC
jgi:hypothetical protein